MLLVRRNAQRKFRPSRRRGFCCWEVSGAPDGDAYAIRHELGLPHAFINTILYLDYDRRGFRYPVLPFHVNCYGSSVIAKRGSSAHLTSDADPNAVDPPGPNPSRCFDVGAAVARALADSPWRVALIASSSWSHAFLTTKHHWIYPTSRATGRASMSSPRVISPAGGISPPRRSRMPASRNS